MALHFIEPMNLVQTKKKDVKNRFSKSFSMIIFCLSL